ncbi:hypothetical protein GF325_08065 [Candidatus Bathyarchaeota archaeon]|nr:hypothetical protein [Candidatus Bathyarchaeota archaeon]
MRGKTMATNVIIVGEMHNDLFYECDAYKQIEEALITFITSNKDAIAEMDDEGIHREVHRVLNGLPKKIPGKSYIKRGGNGNNSSELFARLGVPIKLMTVVGRGAGWMIQEMDDLGVDTSCIFQLEETTPISTIIEDPTTTKIFTAANLKAKMNFSSITLDASYFQDSSIVFFTPLAPKFTPILEILQSSRITGMTAVTIERQATPNWKAFMSIMEGVKVDLLFINDRDALYLTGKEDVGAADEILKEYSAMRVYTLGSKGSLIKSEWTRDVALPVYDVPVVDRTGAGDAFAAGVLLKIHEIMQENGHLVEEMETTAESRILEIFREIATFGTAVASLKVSLARTPSSDEVREFISKHGILDG